MTPHKCAIAFVLGLAFSTVGLAQAPAGAPAGSTGQCKDATYTTNATKQGACRGHKGVQTWFAAAPAKGASSAKTSKSRTSAATPALAAPAPAAPAPAAVTPPPAPASMSRAKRPTGAPAAGGGPGMVWVNGSTNVYHCYGSRYYGTTKSGKYETEAQAKGAGAHPDHGKGCS